MGSDRPYTGPERRIHVVYVTKHTEYHVRDGVCISVQEKGDPQPAASRRALNMRVAGYFGPGSLSTHPGPPETGFSIHFANDAAFVVTSPVLAVKRPPKEVVETYPSRVILVVDDDSGVRDLIEGALKLRGYAVRTAADGIEALEVYRSHLSQIGLVVLDYLMPRMGGCDAFVALKQVNPKVRVLFMSGYADGLVGPDAADSSYAGFLKKPFGLSALVENVERALEKGSIYGYRLAGQTTHRACGACH